VVTISGCTLIKEKLVKGPTRGNLIERESKEVRARAQEAG
jgi:hypothetical protein